MKLSLIRVPNIPSQSYRNFYGDYPGITSINRYLPPLAIASLAGFLRSRNINVIIDDMDIKINHKILNDNFYREYNLGIALDRKRMFEYMVENKIDRELDFIGEILISHLLKKEAYENVDIIGFSTEREFNDIAALLLIAKKLKQNVNAKIIIGGFEAGDFPVSLFKLGGLFDFGILEDGEIPLYKFLQFQEKEININEVPNLIYKDNGEILFTGTPGYLTPEDFVIPDFDGFPMDLYKSSGFTGDCRRDILILPIQFIRGCRFSCPFCKESVFKGLKMYPPGKVAEGITYLKNKYSTDYFIFLNNELNPTDEYARNLAEEMIKQNLQVYWSDSLHFFNFDKQLISLLKKAGAVRLIWGLESGSQRMLDYIDKRIDLQSVPKVLEFSKELGVWNGLEIIAGMPYEQEEDIRLTMEFIKTHGKYVDTIYLNHFCFYNNSRFGKQCRQFKLAVYNDDESVEQLFSYDPFWGHRFDEIHGLKWEDKKKQISHSFNQIKGVVQPDQRFCSFMDILAYGLHEK